MAPATIRIRKLVNPTEAEITAVVDIIVIAFEETRDPFVNAILGGELWNRRLNAAMSRCYVRGALVDGEVWVAETEVEKDGKMVKMIIGEALWFLPGKSFMGSEEQRTAVKWEEYTAILKPGLEEWFVDYCLPRLHTLWDDCAGSHALEDNYHLQILAVLPGYQGQFIARALVRPVVARAVREGKRILGEATSAQNVESYKSVGCFVLGEESFQSRSGDFKLWPMEVLPSGLEGNAYWAKGTVPKGLQSSARL